MLKGQYRVGRRTETGGRQRGKGENKREGGRVRREKGLGMIDKRWVDLSLDLCTDGLRRRRREVGRRNGRRERHNFGAAGLMH